MANEILKIAECSPSTSGSLLLAPSFLEPYIVL